MCGICGQIDFHANQAPGKSAVDAVMKMMAVMEKRGPDAMGLYATEAVALGHRRLKIIDLSERAAQPMTDPHTGLSIVYNGAIYNYPELRKELEEKGYLFFSTGDTEVILKAYHAWGEDCVQRFNGMFAFAIHHRDTGRVFIARDRLGIKPLYYTRNGKRFRFASFMPALVAAGEINSEIDREALHHYMSFHSVVPAPNTILKDVKKLAPATTLTIDPDGTSTEKIYWDLSFSPLATEKHHAFEDWQAALRDALEKAVKRRLIADVPVGVLLSGGLDSSLVVGLLAEMGQTNLHTFSIGFPGVDTEEGNEFRYSDLIAAHYGTRHHKIEADAGDVLSNLDDCIRAMSEPMVSHDCIGFYLLSRAVTEHVKVVQSGQGADEIFAGYHWYPPMMESRHPARDYRRVFFDRDHDEFTRAVHPRFVTDDHSRKFVEGHFGKAGASAPIDRALRIDTQVMLVEDPVKRVDNMTMAWGLEARVPFLDHELVETAARIPAEYKVKGGGKYILKETARKLIPAAVIDRPKGYFPVPVLKYIEGEYLQRVREILLSPQSREREIFQPEYMETILSDPKAHITPLKGSKLWQMALLEHWLTLQGL